MKLKSLHSNPGVTFNVRYFLKLFFFVHRVKEHGVALLGSPRACTGAHQFWDMNQSAHPFICTQPASNCRPVDKAALTKTADSSPQNQSQSTSVKIYNMIKKLTTSLWSKGLISRNAGMFKIFMDFEQESLSTVLQGTNFPSTSFQHHQQLTKKTYILRKLKIYLQGKK